MSEGRHAPAQITTIENGQDPDSQIVFFSFQPSSGAGPIVANQKSSPAALRATGIQVGSTVEARFMPKWPRWGFIDALARAERGAPQDNSADGPTFFYISCTGSPSAGWAANSKMNFGCVGGAELVIDATAFSIAGIRPRPFLSPVKVLRRVALEDVVNVEQHGVAIRLVVREQDTTSIVQIRARDTVDADHIVLRLPATKTSSFVPEMAERAEFSQTLQEISPKTPVTQALVIINIAVFILCAVLGAGVIGTNPQLMIKLGTNYTPLTLDGQWWRLVTSMFLHFGLLHVAFNMLALYVNGSVAERIFGSLRYSVIYLVAGICGSVASLLWHSQANAAGASGAIFGVLGAMIAFFLRSEAGVPRSVVKAQLNSAGLFVFYNLVIGASSQGIDNAAHLGGLAGGFIMGFLLSRPLQADRVENDWTRQWLIAFSAMAAASVGMIYLIAHKANPAVRTFGGVKLGMPIDQLTKAKGQPINRQGLAYIYNSVDSRHNGVITALLASEEEGLVRAAGNPLPSRHD
jgi:rhomboid protease GluP